MSSSPEMKRTDDRYQNVEDEGSWPNYRGGDAEQCHDCDVTGCAGMAYGRIEKRNDSDRCEKKKEMRCIHHSAIVTARRKGSKDQLFSPLADLIYRRSSIVISSVVERFFALSLLLALQGSHSVCPWPWPST